MNERSLIWGLPAAGLVASAASGLILLACGGDQGKTSGVAGSRLPEGSHSEALEHEACDERSSDHRIESLDANRDGKDDIRRVFDKGTGKEICRITDLNHDGKPDMFEYYDASGQLRRREADYDDSGVVDAIEFYENGKLARRELDTTGQHRIDTWDYFDPATGKRVRRERDSTNDGRVDQWWTWQGDQVTIAIDKSGDGKPDPTATVVIGGNGQAIEDAGGPPGAPVLDASVGAPVLAPANPQSGPEIDTGAPPSPVSSGDAGASKADKADAGKGAAKPSGGKK